MKYFAVLVMLISTVCFAQPKTKGTLIAKATAHSVNLTCQAPTSGTTPTGYYFYRGTTPGGESATALNSAYTATCAYVDTAVAPLATYYYVAKAYCATCTAPGLTGPSNETQAVIPGDPLPNPPTGLTATSQ